MPDTGDRLYECERIGTDAGPRRDRVAWRSRWRCASTARRSPWSCARPAPIAISPPASCWPRTSSARRRRGRPHRVLRRRRRRGPRQRTERDRDRRGGGAAGRSAGQPAPGDDDRVVRPVRAAHHRVVAGACDPVNGAWTVPAAVVRRCPPTLRAAQRVFEATGGLHAAGPVRSRGPAAADGGGRRPAQRGGQDLRPHAARRPAAAVTARCCRFPGRTSFELVQKALLAGIPLIAAVSAPSSLAIDLAREAGITLCGFVRGETFNVYAHPERIA